MRPSRTIGLLITRYRKHEAFCWWNVFRRYSVEWADDHFGGGLT